MKRPYIAVCGNINIDICGKAFSRLIPGDSNPGAVELSLGGVGRNIAHDLRLLGQQVTMLTALGDDFYTPRILESCRELGIDLSHALHVPGGRTGSYVVLTAPGGEVALAVCDATLIEQVTPDYLAAHLQVLNEAAAVVLDTNLTQEAIVWLAEHCAAPLFADPVSVTKAEKLRPVLSRLHTLKPNRAEAELLSGVKITDERSLAEAANALLSTGLRRVVISLGSDGAYCAERGCAALLPCPKTALVNATGGGDAMMAGLLSAWCEGLSLADSCRFALACGSIAVEGSGTVNPALSLDAAKRRANM